MGQNTFGVAGEIFTRVALPVTTMDEDEAQRIWHLGRVEIPALPRPGTIRHIEPAGMGAAKCDGLHVAPLDQSRAVGNGRIIVVGGVAFRLAQRGPSGEHSDGYAATA
jgi:hypothetical protein